MAGPGPNSPLARWREAREWWLHVPTREFVEALDDHGVRRQYERSLPSAGDIEKDGQKPLIENHNEEWDLRERKVRDEKAAAAQGRLPHAYYQRQTEEKQWSNERNASLKNALRETAWSVAVGSSDQAPARWNAGKTARPYVPLHVHSGYAFGRSTLLAEEIAANAAHGGCPAAAIADPHSLVGAFEHAKACNRMGIKALIGATVELPEGGELVLLATNAAGYVNLSHLVTECHLGEPRGFPLGSWSRLEAASEGLLCLTGGDAGPLDRLLVRRDYAGAEQLIERLAFIFGRDRLFVEVERSYLPWTVSVGTRLLELAAAHQLLPVAGGTVTHARREHFPAQDTLVCAHTLCTIEEVLGRKPMRDHAQPTAPHFPERALNAERHLRTAQEMERLFADRPDLLDNTLRVADLCENDVLPRRTGLPRLFEDDGHALREIVDAGAFAAYGKVTPRHRKRLGMEVDRIASLGYASHFLIAWDFCRWSREQGIQMSGRGSVVDSAVAYVLGFSRIDAFRHDLHFDRFLPSDGSKRPDIDIDFEARRRDDVRGYIVRKYGIEKVANVAAIGAYGTRGIIREVGKVFGLPNETIGFLAKRIHGGVAPDRLEAALANRPELRDSQVPTEKFRWVLRLAERMMDIPRNIRTHSSGVVVSDRPIRDVVPVMWSATPSSEESGSEEAQLRMMQWDKRSAKHVFDKFDVLCLRGQDVLSGVETRVRRTEPDFSVERVEASDDPEVYRAMRSGELIGIPQSASPAMRQAHVRLRTDNLDDASLVQAGIRPGVGGAVKLNELIARRRGKPYSFEHPELERILGHTYGIIVFQEQVDQLLQTFGGYTSGEAEDIRDSIHKRRREDYGHLIREKIMARVAEAGFGQSVADRVFEAVAGFKGYGFAQGHALAFSEISLRSVWAMQNYPAEYFASLLSAQPAGYYGPATIANEARNRGVRILSPDVNLSGEQFTVESARDVASGLHIPNGAIRTALAQIAGLSKPTLQRIYEYQAVAMPADPVRALQPLTSVAPTSSVAVATREADVPPPPRPRAFRSVFDFAQKIRPNRDELESLVLCGAFDTLHPNRRALLWAIPQILEFAGCLDPKTDHPALPLELPEPPLPRGIPDFDVEERAVHERSLLHMDVDRHLLAFERDRIQAKGGLRGAEIKGLAPGARAFVVGNPIRLRFPPTPSGKRVVFFDLEDESGLLNVTCFDQVYQRYGRNIVCSPYATVLGEVQDRDGFPAFLATQVFPYQPTMLGGRAEDLPIGAADFLVG